MMRAVMPLVATLSGGDWALIILAAFWGLLVLFLALVMLTMFRVLESTKTLIDGIRTETVPLIGEVRVTVVSVNKELDRVDGIMDSAGKMAKSVQRITAVVEQTVSNPLIKFAAFTAGASRALKRLRGEK
jgi:uncharacterized protein YoxC